MSPLKVNVFSNKQADIKVIGKTKGESVRSTCLGIFTSNNDKHFVDNPSFGTSLQPSFGLFLSDPISKQKSAATYRAIQNKNGDILLAPMYTIRTEKGLICTKTTVKVTGYAAKMVGFVNINKNDDAQDSQSTPTLRYQKAKEDIPQKVPDNFETKKPIPTPQKIKKEEEKIETPSIIPSPKTETPPVINSKDKLFSVSILQAVGSLSENEITQAFFAPKRKFNECFLSNNEQSVEISVFLLVKSTGKIISYNLLNSSSKDDSFVSCILNDLSNLQFSSFSGISNVRVKLSSDVPETK